MPYDFFFSYRRADFGAPMREFFTDLGEEVRKLRGLDKTEQPAFFDQSEIETGDNWDAALMRALQQSRVLVPLYSPAYFKSEYCGKEWRCFELRRQAYAMKHGVVPAVIKPVVWVPTRKDSKLALPEHVGEAVKRVQFTWREEDAPVNQHGLEQIVRLKASHAQVYWDFVRGFAEEISETIEKVALPPLDPVPLLDEVGSAFGNPRAPVLAQPARPAGSGFRRHVRFIFAALDPAEIGGERDPAPYHDRGGPDWKPFYPELQRRIGALAAHIVSDSDLDFDSDHIELTHDLAGAVRAALNEGKPVVVFVDRWSLFASAAYQEIFREFDGQNFNNCAVLLPWNPSDPELATSRASIDQVIGDVLHFRRQYAPSSPYFCKEIDSLEDLRATLHAVLNQIQAEMRRNAPLRRPLPLGIARPTISGPGA